jgi:hypothetical protein
MHGYKNIFWLGMVTCAYNSSTQLAEAKGSRISSPPGVHSEIMSQGEKKKSSITKNKAIA